MRLAERVVDLNVRVELRGGRSVCVQVHRQLEFRCRYRAVKAGRHFDRIYSEVSVDLSAHGVPDVALYLGPVFRHQMSIRIQMHVARARVELSAAWIFDHQESFTLNCNIQGIVRRLNATLVEDLPDGADLSTQADSHRVTGFCSADGVECLAQHVGERDVG